MTRRSFLGLFTLPTPGRTAPNIGESYVISMGQLTAAEHEVEGGYFGIAQATAIMVRPDSPGWHRLKELRGSTVSLIVRVD